MKPGKEEALRLLLVEHTPADVELSLLELERGGLNVCADVVSTPEDLEARLRANAYDIVLADYRLPGWTGMDALAVLQQHHPEVPLILVTGTLGDELAVDCLRQGIADYVTKQNLTRLPHVVRRVLDERRLRDERAASAEALRATEERYRVLFDSMPVPVWVFDVETHEVLAVNQAAVKHYGYTEEEFLGLRIEDLRPQDTIARLHEHTRSSPRTGGVQSSGRWQHLKKDGTPILVEITWHPVTWGGKAAEIVAANDITERTLAEEALRASEEQFRQLADNINELFFISDPKTGNSIYLSPAYEEIWGRSRESAYATPGGWLEGIHPEDRTRLAQVERGGGSPEPSWDVFRVVRPDGSIRWVRSHASPVLDSEGLVYRIVGVAEDFTDRRRAEEALAESEARYRKLTEASFDGIAITQEEFIRQANRGFAEIFGYSLEEVIGRPVTDFVPEDYHDIVRTRMADGVDGSYEIEGQRKDGSRIQLEITAKTHNVGGLRGRITALRDVTQKRLLEDQVRQTQKMEAIGRLAGGVAHDFNNLLTIITSCTELLLMDTEELDPRRDNLEEIRKAAQGAAGLTRQLLTFSRQQVIDPRLVTVEEVVAKTEKMLQRLIGEDVELLTVLNHHPSTVKIDPGQLEQVIMNLAVNARDAMPDGGKLTVETSAAELDDTYARTHWPAVAGRFALLAVSDTGSGMTPETRARIFEPFFTTKELGKGTGLGLATAYGIIKQAGGFIWVYSEPGHGTVFKIYLPLMFETPEPHTEPAPVTSLLGNETIVLTEDAASLRATARQILTRYGYNVLEAPNGKAALALAANCAEPIHLLLTDVVMPQMSGRELAERFQLQRPDVKVLYMSGYMDDAVVRHGVLQPGIAYLQKPFTPESLGRKVREVLDSSPHSRLPGESRPEAP